MPVLKLTVETTRNVPSISKLFLLIIKFYFHQIFHPNLRNVIDNVFMVPAIIINENVETYKSSVSVTPEGTILPKGTKTSSSLSIYLASFGSGPDLPTPTG